MAENSSDRDSKTQVLRITHQTFKIVIYSKTIIAKSELGETRMR